MLRLTMPTEAKNILLSNETSNLCLIVSNVHRVDKGKLFPVSMLHANWLYFYIYHTHFKEVSSNQTLNYQL